MEEGDVMYDFYTAIFEKVRKTWKFAVYMHCRKTRAYLPHVKGKNVKYTS